MESKDSELFSISDQPESVSNFSHAVPHYRVDHIYDIDGDSESVPTKKRKNNRNVCWNCGGSDHSLRQCPLPHNSNEIKKNKASFAIRNEFKRYHVDLKDEGIFSQFRPGVISEKLREALGLDEDQLPMHIYKMRTLGYPPGWLLEAKFDSSGIEMFDMEGNRVPNADEEEGEIGSTSNSAYDESKIISYPGFNEWPPPGTLDETKRYGVPDLKYMQCKEDFIKSLKNRSTDFSVSYEKKMQEIPNVFAGECDMETEEIEDVNELPEDGRCSFIPPLPDEDALPPPPPPEDGEIQDGEEKPCEERVTPPPVIEENLLPEESSSHGKIVSIDLGTPVLKIHSPYNKLPPPEKFQKDISDVINFENLPDSTGAYEKLKGVLKNVRSKLSTIKGNKMNNTI